jgi:hypothetical protein
MGIINRSNVPLKMIGLNRTEVLEMGKKSKKERKLERKQKAENKSKVK